MGISTTDQRKYDRIKLHASSILKRAEAEGRDLTDEENATYAADEKTLGDLERDNGLSAALDNLAGGKDFGRLGGGQGLAPLTTRLSLGDQFLASETFSWLKEHRNKLSGAWTSPASDLLMAATLTEGAGSGGALVVPQYLPEIQPSPLAPVVMSPLFSQGQATSNAVVFFKETLYTSGAAPVLETGLKPESTLTFAQVNEMLRKIAHHLPVTEEMLEDAPQIRSYIDGRLRDGVLVELDDQLLNGSGVAPEMLGFLIRTDLQTALAATAGAELEAIATMISTIESSQAMRVSGIAMNPTTWLSLSLKKTSTGEFLGTGPFGSPQTPTLFGRPVAQTPMLPAGKALVGAFNTGGAQLFIRNGIQVKATNSHGDDFLHDIVRIRAELRAALATYRPKAFGLVTALGPTP
jgi:HK97 family phage major capsid protein